MPTRALLGQFCKTSFSLAAVIILAACGGTALTDGPVAEVTPSIDIPIEDLLVYVPAGTFYMGSDPELDPIAQEDEQPLHSVVLDGYFIYRNEVSNGLYKQCVADGECSDPTMFEDGPSTFYNHPDYQNNPVVGVTWDQAAAFCGWADARLPTEAEWEKTSRGEDAELYPWGDEAPTCDLSNMAGCIVPPDDDSIPETERIGQFPEGESIYEANDLAGNVWEWTLDWYDEDYYELSPYSNPLGPENGELRVVRGGSYEDGSDALRSAERMALDPEEAYNNVGFRCVPMGVDRAAAVTPPFCQQTYVPFCRDPHDDPNDGCEPVDTTDVTPTPSNNIDFGGFGCPDGGLITVTLESGTPISEDHTITVGGVVFNCYDSTIYPGRVVCEGSPPPAGSVTTVTVCPDSDSGANRNVAGLGAPQGPEPAQVSLVAYRPQAAPAPAGLEAYQPTQEAPVGLKAYQPTQEAPTALQGFEAQQPANLVAYQAAAINLCPTGYVMNPETGQCEQDPNGACPEGWTYNETTGQCELGEDGCPDGTTPGADGCTPDTGDECPAGWFFDEAAGTCQPPANDDGGGACPAGYFYDRAINCCSPIPSDNVGCDPGFYRSVATNQCEPVDQNGCPDGTVYNRYEGGCVHDYGQDDGGQSTQDTGCRLAGYIRDDNGVCVPGDSNVNRIVSVCEEGSYYDEQLGECVTLEDGACGPGYRLNPASNTCVPNDGPGSGCAAGYSFSERYNCCVATPGNEGSFCPGDEAAQTGRLVSYPQPSGTGYDYGNGYCDPVGAEQCPSGYAFDEQTQSCVAIVGRINTVEGCPDGTYYDESLGYCVQTSCGCELGYEYNPRTQTCDPIGGEPETTEGCWTYQVSVPTCPYQQPTTPPCDPDERWNQQTQQCETDYDPEVGTGCAQYMSQSACSAAGCNWYAFSSPRCFP